MANILKKLHYEEYIINRFKEQKITPDIISKLSSYELEQLGVRNRSDIMDLRIVCSKYGRCSPPRTSENCGAPKFLIPKFTLENLLNEDFTIHTISTMLSVSERTIYRRMSEFGLSKRQFSDITPSQLDTEVKKISQEFPNCGENMVRQILFDIDIKVTRMQLRDSIHRC